jgi:pilus assembly protein Flp/PilA
MNLLVCQQSVTSAKARSFRQPCPTLKYSKLFSMSARLRGTVQITDLQMQGKPWGLWSAPGISLESGNIAKPGINEFTERSSMKDLFVRLWKEEEGQDLTEYALLLVLLALAATATLNTLATAIKSVFTNAATNLNTAST